jgi:hypothetical protein
MSSLRQSDGPPTVSEVLSQNVRGAVGENAVLGRCLCRAQKRFGRGRRADPGRVNEGNQVEFALPLVHDHG